MHPISTSEMAAPHHLLSIEIASSGSSGSVLTTAVSDDVAIESPNDGNAALWTWCIVGVIACLVLCGGAYYGSKHYNKWIGGHQSRDIGLAEQQKQKVHSIEIGDYPERGTMEQSTISADGDGESRQIANETMERNDDDDDDDE